MPKFLGRQRSDDSLLRRGSRQLGRQSRRFAEGLEALGMMIVYCRGGGGTREFPCITTQSIKFQLFHKVLEPWNNTKPNKNKGLQAYIYIKLQSSIIYYYKAGKFLYILYYIVLRCNVFLFIFAQFRENSGTKELYVLHRPLTLTA